MERNYFKEYQYNMVEKDLIKIHQAFKSKEYKALKGNMVNPDTAVAFLQENFTPRAMYWLYDEGAFDDVSEEYEYHDGWREHELMIRLFYEKDLDAVTIEDKRSLRLSLIFLEAFITVFFEEKTKEKAV